VDGGSLRIQFWSEDTVRITYSTGAELPVLKSLAVVASPAAVRPARRQDAQAYTLATPLLKVRIDRRNGAVSFLDPAGKVLLREAAEGRAIVPATQAGSDPALQIPTIQSVRICYVTGHSAGVRAQPRGADPVALGMPILRRGRNDNDSFPWGMQMGDHGFCDRIPVKLGHKGACCRTAPPPRLRCQMKERDAVVQMRRQASLLGSL